MNNNLEQALYQATVLTFEELGFLFPTMDEPEISPANCAISVTFSGVSNGKLVLRADNALLPVIAANMLGEDEPPSEAIQRDAFGEIANVICGNLLPTVFGKEAVMRLTAPMFINGETTTETPAANISVRVDEGCAAVSLYLND